MEKQDATAKKCTVDEFFEEARRRNAGTDSLLERIKDLEQRMADLEKILERGHFVDSPGWERND